MMSKLQFLFLCLTVFTIQLHAQIFEPVQWSTSVEKVSDTEYDLISTAIIDKGWHLYAQNVPDGGPIPTTFSYEDSDSFNKEGATSEDEGVTVDDPVFNMKIKFFEDEAVFRQRISILNNELSLVKGEVEFMVCDDEKCLPPNVVELVFQLNSNGAEETTNPFQTDSPNILEPISWSVSVRKVNQLEYDLTYLAEIDGSWHLYSQDSIEGIGPLPTEFVYTNIENNYELIGTTSEPDVAPVYDKVFEKDIKYFNESASFTQRIKLTNDSLKFITSEVFYMVCNDEKCIPGDEQFKVYFDGSVEVGLAGTLDEHSTEMSDNLKLEITGWDNYERQDVEEKSSSIIFFLGFVGGLIALLTPCVFPMIPLTVSFFTKSSSSNKKGVANSILYGFFIFLIYALLSLPFHLIDSLDPEILNNISTNVTLNIIFFLVFLAFAFSFFGYFELTLPSSWSNALDSKANTIGGIIGIFLMALTLAIVSFSCTGPILGTLLGSSLTADGGATQLSLGMSGFGLALALPFTLFAMFPKWLNSMPKSGGWLNTVKVVLGFIELALALKFLSNADLVEHWGLLKREVFIGLWILIGIGLALYLFGKIKFPHDSPITKLSKGRIGVGILTLIFVIYLIPGLSNSEAANLKLLSGFPPPLFYSVYDKATECPLGLNCYKDFDEGLEAAKAENKPIMLDFTGWACVNCRKMEEHVWSVPKVHDILNNDYVIISLYVDDREVLPEERQFEFLKPSGNIKKIRTIGDKWATFQTINFKNNSQPYYVLLNHEMELLNHTTPYTPNVEEYFNWLQTGLENYNTN